MNNLSANLNYTDEAGLIDVVSIPATSNDYLSLLINKTVKPQLTHDQSYELAVTKFCNMIIGRSR